jgi:CpXC protein
MSKFATRILHCPRCRAPAERSLAVSLNAARTPQARQAILDGSFQRFRCIGCGQAAVADDPFMYVDFDRKDWIALFPLAWEGEWRRRETEPRRAFDLCFAGPGAAATARSLAHGFRVRATFGVEALREKLVAFSAGIDDACLEALKLELMRTTPGLCFNPGGRPRLTGADDERLTFSARGERKLLEVNVPRSAYDRLAAARDQYAPLLDRLSGVPWVDLGRLFLA